MTNRPDEQHNLPRCRALHSANECRLLIIDVQEKLIPVVDGASSIIKSCQSLAEAAAIFEVPARVTEQYPKGLGHTVLELSQFDPSPAAKLDFSAAEAAGFGSCSSDEPRDRIVVCGIETHICVLQTALELQSLGWRISVVADAVGSRNMLDHRVGQQRLRDNGIDLVTTEMVLFEWAERAGTSEFKQISQLVRHRDELQKSLGD